MNPSEAVEILRRTPDTMRAMLDGLSDGWLGAGAGREDWGPYEVVGHLVEGERADWLPRARIIFEHGTGRSFDPFDREGHLGAEPRPLAALLDDFASLRERNLAALAELPVERVDAVGLHPVFGEVTFGQLLATWAVHDLTHVAQAAEVLARRWREEVGPWRAYLPALDREQLPG